MDGDTIDSQGTECAVRGEDSTEGNNVSSGFSPLRKKNRQHSDKIFQPTPSDEHLFSQIHTQDSTAFPRGVTLFASQHTQPLTQDSILLNQSDDALSNASSSVANERPFDLQAWGKRVLSNTTGSSLFPSQDSSIFASSQLSLGYPNGLSSTQQMLFASQMSQDFTDRMGQLHMQEDSFLLGRPGLSAHYSQPASDTDDSFDPTAALMGEASQSLPGQSVPATTTVATTTANVAVSTSNLPGMVSSASNPPLEQGFARPGAPSSKTGNFLATSTGSSSAATSKSDSDLLHKARKATTTTTTTATTADAQQENNHMILVERERHVTLHPVLVNPLLHLSSSSLTLTPSESYFAAMLTGPRHSSLRSSLPKLTKVWQSPYQEHSRYFREFEEVVLLGTGTFSKVHCVRHRLDGMLYAIKIIRERIVNKKQEQLLLREVNALALLSNAGCPNLIRYFGCWVEDAQLYVQLEVCHVGSLEDLIARKPSRTSFLATGIGFDQSNDNKEQERVDSANREKRSESCASILLSGSQSVVMDDLDSSIPLSTPRNSVPLNRGKSSSKSSSSSSTNNNNNNSFPAAFPNSDNSNNHLHNSSYHTQSQSMFEYTQDALHTQVDDQSQDMDHSRAVGEVIGVAEGVAWQVLRIVAETLQFMHLRGFVHLDLRPANFFLQESSSTAHSLSTLSTQILSAHGHVTPRMLVEAGLIHGLYLVKVGDLGHCRHVQEVGLVNEGENRYCPRELINSDPHQLDLTKADIFSLAASVYELCLGRFLGSSGEEEMIEWHSIRDGQLHESFTSRYSPALCALVLNMMHVDPLQRPCAEAIVTVSRQHCAL